MKTCFSKANSYICTYLIAKHAAACAMYVFLQDKSDMSLPADSDLESDVPWPCSDNDSEEAPDHVFAIIYFQSFELVKT